MANAADFQRVKELIETDPTAKEWYQTLHGRAEAMVERPANPRDSGKLLYTSRQTLLHISQLAGIYQLSGDERFAQRAIQELLDVCDFRDWNADEEFLATAEMTTGVAVGYDWLYSVLTARQRDHVRNAIINKGLRPGLEFYEQRKGWSRANHNQNLVCNGAMIVGALAVLDEQPAIARQVLEYARQSIRLGLESFAPDGAWGEGPTYWIYGTRYLAYAGSSLESALNTDWGLSRVNGLGKTGLFRIYASGPTDLAFNFGDASASLSNSAQLFWLSRMFDRPEYAAWEQKWIGRDVGIFDLLWYKPAEERAIAKLPLDARFRGTEMISLRGSWDDPNATFVAFKGGSTEFKHSHLDFGTFVLDALGERWAIDLGGDSYELPGYFGDRRTSYYRTTTRGHNTFTIDGRSQNPKATVPIKTFFSTESRAGGVLDMDDAYRGDAWHASRGIQLLDRRQVLVQDEIDPSDPAEIIWSMHTNAEVQINRSTAKLRQNGKTMTVRILSPSDARFDLLGVRLNPPQEPVKNVRRLYIRLPSAIKHTTIAVLFTPGDREGRVPRIEPLDQWSQTR